MLSDVFVRFEVQDGDVVGYIYDDDPNETGAEPVACIWIVPPYLALANVGAFMAQLANVLHIEEFHPYKDKQTFYIS